MASLGLSIGGRQVRVAGKLFDVINPFDGQVIAQAPKAEAPDLDAAVQAAKGAFPAWSVYSWEQRQALLRECANLLVKNKDELAKVLTLEQGKGLPQSMGEVLGANKWMQLAAARPCPNKVAKEDDKMLVKKVYKPIGVVGCITAWNFPLILIFFKISQALLAGCTIVLKPSEHTPLVTLMVGQLFNTVLPPGVLNVLSSDDKNLGREMVEHPGIDKISFTGSTATGKHILASAAKTLKRVTVELGGNDAAVVLPDCDPTMVAPYIFRGAFSNSGQVCMAIKRIYCHESIYDKFCDALGKEAAKAKFGNGVEKGVLYGPINNAMQYAKVRELLVDAVEHGAEIVQGKVPPALDEQKGFLFPPVILKGVSEGTKIVDEEQFGPVVPVMSFKTTEEAITRANASNYGLGASVWTTDENLASEVASQLQAGTVWTNDHGNIVDDFPFGGAKESGLGHEGGEEGLLAFMQLHVIKVKKGKTKFAKL